MSAHSPNDTCEFHSRFSGLKKSTKMGCFERVAIVRGVINCLARGVIITLTSAPSFTKRRQSIAALYAAMLPVIPRIMCLPLSIIVAVKHCPAHQQDAKVG